MNQISSRSVYGLLLQCREELSVHGRCNDTNVMSPYQNKGEIDHCTDNCAILLCIVGKVFAGVVQNRLQFSTGRVYSEAQGRLRVGGREGGLTVDVIIFTATAAGHVPLAETTRLHRREGVGRSNLFKLLQNIGRPPNLLKMVEVFPKDIGGAAKREGSNGVKQGGFLAPISREKGKQLLEVLKVFLDRMTGTQIWKQIVFPGLVACDEVMLNAMLVDVFVKLWGYNFTELL
ncbi:hypothetical protein EGW08_010787 [Elysia chlorotica]|uniref:Uncharacterized protein n=1 Tax=Elysia chlorotica TaxID=188477 RepID=A0A3S0ZL35_ELYCH|nr:hypothetical protein EGW08_010787 [Elysia chlorotica]